jgi:hypothetical protein
MELENRRLKAEKENFKIQVEISKSNQHRSSSAENN